MNIDHEEAAYEAVKKLIDNGHERIVHVSGPMSRDINRLCKKVGYERALKEAGLPIIEEFFIETNNTYDDAYEKWSTIRDLKEKPTAIFAGNDDIAVGCFKWNQG